MILRFSYLKQLGIKTSRTLLFITYADADAKHSVNVKNNFKRFISFEKHNKSKMNSLSIKYEEAVRTLNGLQSNANVLEKIRKSRKIFESNNVVETQKYLERVDLGSKNLDKLAVIHLAGTKGKGSTCAFIESILREHGYKTGFYSSPHLVAVRERIRINGMPIDKKDFLHYFWETYNSLYNKKSDENDMPAYFKFLTILAFKVFLKEDVDVAIVEVGIGGEFDCTNVVRHPVVCGITSLDIDHVSQLGVTIESIAWHKAGIMKSNVPIFTVSQQPSEAVAVLLKRSEEKQSHLFVAPPLESYGWGGRPIQLGLSGYVQFLNASLALQISHYFMRRKNDEKHFTGFTGSDEKSSEKCGDNLCGQPFTLSENDLAALANVVWPGRSQVLSKGSTLFFLDGAHTISSIQNCIDWYSKMSSIYASNENGRSVFRVLVFNITGDRDHEAILRKLFHSDFDMVIFTTNMVTKDMAASSDQTNFTVSEVQHIARCQKLRKCWLKLGEELDRDMKESCLTFYCIKDVLLWLSCGNRSFVQGEMMKRPVLDRPEDLRVATQVQVLVTGSLHLVGGFLGILDPSLSCSESCSDSLNNSSMADFVKRKFTGTNMSAPGTS